MNIMVLGAGGFIGTNLVNILSANGLGHITAVDSKLEFLSNIDAMKNISLKGAEFNSNTNFETLIEGQDVIYHLVSSVIPSTANKRIKNDIENNVLVTTQLMDACVKQKVKKVIFISSGGTVYGNNVQCPIKETHETFPITSYGLQKEFIEKILHLYYYIYGIDYKVIRLSNPYGPYQRPNAGIGVVTTFIYKMLRNEPITVYGNGNIIRDYIYIDDAVNAILKIADTGTKYKIYNVGSGHGMSINDVISVIKDVLDCDVLLNFAEARNVDVPINYLDISRYETEFGRLATISFEEGIMATSEFLKKQYMI